jgi:hypothetical protein
MRIWTTVIALLAISCTAYAQSAGSPGAGASRPQPERPTVPERPATPERPITPERPAETYRPTLPERATTPERIVTPDRPAVPERPPVAERPTVPERPIHIEEPGPPRQVPTPERPTGPQYPPLPEREMEIERPMIPEHAMSHEPPRGPGVSAAADKSRALQSVAFTESRTHAMTTVERALASRDSLIERARANRDTNLSIASGVSAAAEVRRDQDRMPQSIPGPQSGTGRIQEVMRERQDSFTSRLQMFPPRNTAGPTAGRGDGAAYGLTSRENDVDHRGPGSGGGGGSEPPSGTFPNPGGGGIGPTRVGNRRGNHEVNVNLNQQLAYLDLMRDRAIDNGDGGGLGEIDRQEEARRRELERRTGNTGNDGGNGRRPESPLPPGGKMGSSWFSGFKNAMKRGRGIFSRR